jgi:dihydroflavonol-4-reductase
VAEAIVNAICKGRSGESYILGGYNISYKDLWTHMLTAMGRQQRAYSFPCAVAAVGRILDGIHRLTNLRERSPNGAEIAMGGLWHYYDSTKAHRELNYRMRELDSTLNDAWQWLKSVHQA